MRVKMSIFFIIFLFTLRLKLIKVGIEFVNHI